MAPRARPVKPMPVSARNERRVMPGQRVVRRAITGSFTFSAISSRGGTPDANPIVVHNNQVTDEVGFGNLSQQSREGGLARVNVLAAQSKDNDTRMAPRRVAANVGEVQVERRQKTPFGRG